MVPLLHLLLIKDKEHLCRGSAGNCSQKGRNGSELGLGVSLHWEAVSTASSQGPCGLPKGQSCLFKKPEPELRQLCLLNYPKQCQVPLHVTHRSASSVGSEGR